MTLTQTPTRPSRTPTDVRGSRTPHEPPRRTQNRSSQPHADPHAPSRTTGLTFPPSLKRRGNVTPPPHHPSLNVPPSQPKGTP